KELAVQQARGYRPAAIAPHGGKDELRCLASAAAASQLAGVAAWPAGYEPRYAAAWVPYRPTVVNDFREVHGKGLEERQTWLVGLEKDGFYPVTLTARPGSEPPAFSAAAVRDGRPVRFRFRPAVPIDPSDKALALIDELRDTGTPLRQLCLYTSGGRTFY